MMKRGAIQLIAAGSFAFLAAVTLGQNVAPKPSFEVVSIKPSDPSLNIRGGGPRGGDRYTMAGATLRMLIQQAYTNPSSPPGSMIEIVGGPSWMDSDRYNIEAKADCSGGILSRDQLMLMVQSMLEDRFQLKARMETRELPVYNLVVAREGLKMKESTDQTPVGLGGRGAPQPCSPVPAAAAVPPPPPPPLPPPGGGQRGFVIDPAQMPRGAMLMMLNQQGMTMQGAGVGVGNLISAMQQFVGRPVIDKTGITGLFDFTLQFSRDGLPGVPGGPTLTQSGGPSPNPFGPGGGGGLTGPNAPPTALDPMPTLFSAIQDLGLRLEATKGPVPVVVIESVQKPSEN
jgi:uncharacterized protein (TIGR03435 family)